VPDDLDRRPPQLIDDQGRVWTRASWATGRQVRQFLGRPQRVAVRDQDGVTRWLSQDDARALWRRIRRHFDEPDGPRAEPDADGLIYQANVWRHDERRLLGFEVYC
jgi:hypothetical protein